MGAYLIKRLALALPVLLSIALISFWLNVNTPGDPVFRALAHEGIRLGEDPMNGPGLYRKKRIELGLDKPVFYFSIKTQAESDSLFSIPFPADRVWVSSLCEYTAQPLEVLHFYQQLNKLEIQLQAEDADSVRNLILTFLRELRDEDPASVRRSLAVFMQGMPEKLIPAELKQLNFPEFKPEYRWKSMLPKIVWYGRNNLFHRWLCQVLILDLGNSFQDGRPVISRIPEALKWTLILNLVSILLAWLVSVPAGVYAARHRNTPAERLLTAFWFVLYALPGFWTATLLILFLGSGEYLDWFPGGGIMDIRSHEDWPWYRKFGDLAHHLILPTIAYTYASFAYLSGQVRNALLDNMGKDYIRTARAKGLPEKIIFWKHALKNSLLPLITLMAQVFPAMVSGSVVLETIFSIPGMGMLTWQAISLRDYPLLIAVFMLSGVMTLAGVLAADLLYVYADPRIRFNRK